MSENNRSDEKMSPKFFFLSLGVLATLITTVVSFLNLAFQTLNKNFPDALNATYTYGYSSWSYDSIRASLATLIIFFPAFLILSYLWKKASSGSLGKIDEVIRKWMIYLILFLSSVVVLVDLVTLVRYFVSGEITERFIYKVVITLVVAVFVGAYYIFELQGRKKVMGVPVGISSVIKSSVLVLALIIWSFSIIGSPKDQRAWRLDERRVQDLQSIQWQVINLWQQKEKLPETLAEMSSPISGFMTPVDPEFEKGLVYEYRKISDMKFELCATFSAEMPQGWQEYDGGGGAIPMFSEGRDMAVSSMPYPGTGGDSWLHDAGRKCFEREIDKDIYPPFPKENKVF